MSKFYAVKVGAQTGIFNNWMDCLAQVGGYSGAIYKRFNTLSEAEQWMTASRVAEHQRPVVRASRPPSTRGVASQPSRATLRPSTAPDATGADRTPATAERSTAVPKVAKRTGPLVVYTDGSAINNSRKGKSSRAGCGVYFGPNDERNLGVPLPGPVQTNQRAEVYASILAIGAVPPTTPLEVRTDSQYLVKAMTSWIKTWRTPGRGKSFDQVMNGDLFRTLDKLCLGRASPCTFKWVRAHSGIAGNEAADALAKAGAERPTNPAKRSN